VRTAEAWFELYGESHKNAVNKAIHWVCIPLIVLSTLGVLQAIPVPGATPWLHGGTVVAALAMLFYGRLSSTILVGMAGVAGTCLAVNGAIAQAGLPIGWISAGIFAGAWVAQFVGHKIEGKKPSFFQDLQFLLVGPAWLLQFVYKKAGVPVTWSAPVAG
jgi:uncharacterized membrane protein YGL010W